MRAVSFDRFGGPGVVEINDVPGPHAGPRQLRIDVRAAAVNAIDCKQRRGELAGGEAAERTVLGVDGAGVVDEVGDGVTDVAVGDEVFSIGQGLQAERAVLLAWAAEPEKRGWNEAGALALVGETAARERVRALAETVDGAFDVVGKTPIEDLIAQVDNPQQVASHIPERDCGSKSVLA